MTDPRSTPSIPVAPEERNEDWPRCRRCDDYEWNHRANALGHRMSWPPMTAREIRVADKIMEALR